MDDLLEKLHGDRVGADDDAAIEGLVELEVLRLRSFHVHHVDRVEVILEMCLCIVLFVGFLLHGVGMCKVNCLSSFVAFEAAWYEPTLFHGFLVLRKPDMVELFHSAFFEDFLRKEVRLNVGSLCTMGPSVVSESDLQNFAGRFTELCAGPSMLRTFLCPWISSTSPTNCTERRLSCLTHLRW